MPPSQRSFACEAERHRSYYQGDFPTVFDEPWHRQRRNMNKYRYGGFSSRHNKANERTYSNNNSGMKGKGGYKGFNNYEGYNGGYRNLYNGWSGRWK